MRASHTRLDDVVTSLCTEAASHGVELPISYVRAVARDGLSRERALRVHRLGDGIVICTAPATTSRLPILLGYADRRGQWYADGLRHVEVHASEPDLDVIGVER